MVAFELLKKNISVFTKEEFKKIVDDFKIKRKVYPDENEILNKMLSAKILIELGPNTYKFRYPYIFYYFSGRYLAYNLSAKEVKIQIDYMINRLYNDKYGNIIIFVCHFANNIEIIEDILLLAYLSLDKYELL